MENVFFSEPRLLWALPIVIILGLIGLHQKRNNKLLIISRTTIFCLLIIALANPYMVVTEITQSKRPLITVISDETASMEIFDFNTAQRIHENLPNSQYRMFSGMSTPLGDKILQYAQQGGSLVLVTDGYNNQGMELKEALSLARSSNVTVFGIETEPVFNDASVEISGSNTAVLGGDYPFSVTLRWALDEFEGTLVVYADNNEIFRDDLSDAGKTASIKMAHNFKSTGNHVLRANIVSNDDQQRENNEYLKAVYVVPKPEVLLITDEDSSPLASVLNQHYQLTQMSEFTSISNKYKTVVLDNQKYSTNMNALKDYVRDGGGLVVIGGTSSYDYGGYRDSTLEDVLPVNSYPSRFEGGKTVVLIMDISGSTRREMSVGGTTFLEYEKALSIELLKSPEFQDDRVGLVVFGTEAFVGFKPTTIAGKHFMINERISSLSPKTGTQEETQLDDGLRLAWDLLNSSGGEGELIVVSDGRVREYPEAFARSVEMITDIEVTTHLIEVKSFADAPGGFQELAAKTGANYHLALYPGSVTIRTEELADLEEPIKEDDLEEGLYGLRILNPNHYITSDLNLDANLTGFNDVTPKSGSQRLVVMHSGKPVLTTWRYGLGRVASMSTDDGVGWAPDIYSARNSQLISRTVNWAVGDPRPEFGRIDADDGWLGTPLEITIASQNLPKIGSSQVEKVGENRYSAILNPNRKGVYYIGDYGIAVNYPREFRDVGLNPEFSNLIMASGGRLFSESEVKSNLLEEARKKSKITVQQRESQRVILLFVALIIFLAETIFRKLKKVKR